MSIKNYLFILFIFLSSVAAAQTATLKGQIIDGQTKEPLSGAFVHFDGKNGGSVTDAFGHYSISGIAPGTYKLKVKYVGFTEYEGKITFTAGQSAMLNVSLLEKTESLKAVKVYGAANAESEASSRKSEKNADNITNVLSAQAMQRSPDINAANALARVSAITIQRNSGSDEAYAIIRGLEPRYNNTLVNGVKVTSPDPVSRFISLSIVPSDLLERVEVSKTLTPEMEGDAIGGTVNLVFKDAPEYEYFKANGSIGYSAIFFNRKFDDFQQGAVQSKSPTQRFGPNYVATPGYFSRSNLDFTKKNAPPTSLLGFTYGRRFLNNKLGFIIADSYQNQFYGTNSQFNVAEPDIHVSNFQPVISDVANRAYSTQQLNNGLSGHLDYKIDENNKISLDNVFLYTRLAQTRLSIDTSILGGNGGRKGPGTGTVYNDDRSFIQNQYLENLKLNGKHVIIDKHLLFDWSGVYSNAMQQAPDRADLSINHLINPDFTRTVDYYDNITRIWEKSGNKDLSAMANLGYKTGLGDNSSLEIKAGGLYRHSTRYNHQNEYILKAAPTANGGKSAFTDIYSSDFIVYNQTGTDQSDATNYTAYENITAGYGEFKLTVDKLDVVGGVRVEGTEQGYHTNPVVLSIYSDAKKTYTDLLPSLQLKYKLTEKSNLRASYFKSIARPALFELVPTPTFGQSTDVTGNPNVQHTEANNYDLRYELYPEKEEQIFVGAFYKDIKNPIEFALNDSNNGQLNTSPQNFGTAKVAGAEIVYSKYFGNLGVSGNYTYTYSNIKSPKDVPEAGSVDGKPVIKYQSRPLQGQTGDVFNLSLLYKNDKQKAFVQLAYTYTSKTLSLVYPNYGYDYYTQPQSFLALSAEKQVTKHFVLTTKVNNILNTPTTVKINNLIQSKDLYNVSFNLGFRYSL
ncbi:TonB-dependent receptor [Mucilaginibacter sp. BJC16-A38]|uniref:TonB-dependent receptor n=1 Tax=Mucilaginibacter phenanthrenivorans TaxID=1234842 RepID=UPI002157CD98|nr:TonB-dependent receptor [Mucilaginibacter phenanthrenivorans]MCR8560708.1 TonB-dependent receptor [Mucilaginibacter phenanthrenivorans]